uniref:DUF19 domain-containing protein n=1 Tax=Caenorhabditis japonica TaxID=281687 RepID=A0A8R1DZX4_CAEJA
MASILIFLNSLIIAVIFGGQVGADEGSSDGLDIHTCLNNMEQLAAEISLIDKAKVEKFFGHCLIFRRCLLTAFSRVPTEEGKRAANDFLNYCNAMEYLTVDFAPCDQKITTRQSKCVQTWEPFPNTSGISDEEEKKKIKEKACLNFFGENGCMEDEITNECGPEKWDEFRKVIS